MTAVKAAAASPPHTCDCVLVFVAVVVQCGHDGNLAVSNGVHVAVVCGTGGCRGEGRQQGCKMEVTVTSPQRQHIMQRVLTTEVCIVTHSCSTCCCCCCCCQHQAYLCCPLGQSLGPGPTPQSHNPVGHTQQTLSEHHLAVVVARTTPLKNCFQQHYQYAPPPNLWSSHPAAPCHPVAPTPLMFAT